MLSPPMKTPRPWPAHSRVSKLLVSTSAALLILFHAFLLWQRVLDLSLFKPGPAIRWLATVALLIGLFRLYRQGASLVRGRNAAVIWVLVLLLHASFWGPLADPSPTCEEWAGTGFLLALPAITITLGIISPSIRKLLARVLESAVFRDFPQVAFVGDCQSYVIRAGFLPTLSCRPPPVISH